MIDLTSLLYNTGPIHVGTNFVHKNTSQFEKVCEMFIFVFLQNVAHNQLWAHRDCSVSLCMDCSFSKPFHSALEQ